VESASFTVRQYSRPEYSLGWVFCRPGGRRRVVNSGAGCLPVFLGAFFRNQRRNPRIAHKDPRRCARGTRQKALMYDTYTERIRVPNSRLIPFAKIGYYLAATARFDRATPLREFSTIARSLQRPCDISWNFFTFLF